MTEGMWKLCLIVYLGVYESMLAVTDAWPHNQFVPAAPPRGETFD